MDTYCLICKKELCNKYFLRSHMLKKHGIQLDDVSPAQSPTMLASHHVPSSSSSTSSTSSSSIPSTSSYMAPASGSWPITSKVKPSHVQVPSVDYSIDNFVFSNQSSSYYTNDMMPEHHAHYAHNHQRNSTSNLLDVAGSYNDLGAYEVTNELHNPYRETNYRNRYSFSPRLRHIDYKNQPSHIQHHQHLQQQQQQLHFQQQQHQKLAPHLTYTGYESELALAQQSKLSSRPILDKNLNHVDLSVEKYMSRVSPYSLLHERRRKSQQLAGMIVNSNRLSIGNSALCSPYETLTTVDNSHFQQSTSPTMTASRESFGNVTSNETRSIAVDEGYCDLCHKQFCNKYYLKKHKQEVHASILTNSKVADSSLNSSIKTAEKTDETHKKSKDLKNDDEDIQIIGDFSNRDSVGHHKDKQTITAPKSSPHVEQKKLVVEPKQLALESKTEVKCDMCTKIFYNKHFLELHKQNKHSGKALPSKCSAVEALNIEENKNHVAVSLIAETARKNSQEKAEEETVKTTSLVEVNNRPNSRNSLRSTGSSDSNHVCPLCNKSFVNKYVLKSHMLRTHREDAENSLGIEVSAAASDQNSLVSPSSSLTTLVGSSNSRQATSTSAVTTTPGQEEERQKKEMSILKIDSLSNGNEIGPYDRAVCDICGKVVCDKYYLKVHKKNKHGVFSSRYSLPKANVDLARLNREVPTQRYHERSAFEIMQSPMKPQFNPNLRERASLGTMNRRFTNGNTPTAFAPFSSSSLSISPLNSRKPKRYSISMKENEMQRYSNASSFMANSLTSRMSTMPTSGSKTVSVSSNPTIYEMTVESNNFFNLMSSGRTKCKLCRKELCSKYFLRKHLSLIHKKTFMQYYETFRDKFRNSMPIRTKRKYVKKTQPDDLQHDLNKTPIDGAERSDVCQVGKDHDEAHDKTSRQEIDQPQEQQKQQQHNQNLISDPSLTMRNRYIRNPLADLDQSDSFVNDMDYMSYQHESTSDNGVDNPANEYNYSEQEDENELSQDDEAAGNTMIQVHQEQNMDDSLTSSSLLSTEMSISAVEQECDVNDESAKKSKTTTALIKTDDKEKANENSKHTEIVRLRSAESSSNLHQKFELSVHSLGRNQPNIKRKLLTSELILPKYISLPVSDQVCHEFSIELKLKPIASDSNRKHLVDANKRVTKPSKLKRRARLKRKLKHINRRSRARLLFEYLASESNVEKENENNTEIKLEMTDQENTMAYKEKDGVLDEHLQEEHDEMAFNYDNEEYTDNDYNDGEHDHDDEREEGEKTVGALDTLYRQLRSEKCCT